MTTNVHPGSILEQIAGGLGIPVNQVLDPLVIFLENKRWGMCPAPQEFIIPSGESLDLAQKGRSKIECPGRRKKPIWR